MVATVAAGAVAGGAQAAPAASNTLTYGGTFPLLDGAQPVSATTTAALPGPTKAGRPTDPIAITTHITSGGYAAELFRLSRAVSLEGVARGVYSVSGPGLSGPIIVSVPQTIPVTSTSPVVDPLVLNASGNTPALVFDRRGKYTVKVTALSLNLTARRADGTPIEFPVADGTTDSDDDATTFDVPLDLSPATQNTVLGSFKIN